MTFFVDLNQLCVLPLLNIYSCWRQRQRIYKWMSSWSQMLHDNQEQILRCLLQFITLDSELNLVLSFALFVSTVCAMHMIDRYTDHSKCAPTSSVNVGHSPAAVSHFCPLSITLHLFPPTFSHHVCPPFNSMYLHFSQHLPFSCPSPPNGMMYTPLPPNPAQAICLHSPPHLPHPIHSFLAI